jgi:hypothetical protein
MFLEFLSHYNTIVSHMIKHTSLRFFHEYRNNPTPYKLKDPLHFLQLPCFYIWTPYQASLRYAYKVGRSYPAGIFLGHTLKSVKDYTLFQHGD